ncbi:MAG TPA: glutathione S-transferase N-terminal domain-containing protein [Solimonas sp.]|nr:glutathione S-transferase N-terminal domain-containing protein [Solimonas sp.]
MAIPARSKFQMETKPAPRQGVTLYCSQESLACIWTRIVLAEKDVDGARLVWVAPGKSNPELAMLNPAQTLPTLTDRETVIHPAQVIVEYLDERYPHPRLLPPDPSVRARLRMAISRFEGDFFPWAETALHGKAAEARDAKVQLAKALVATSRLFPVRGWFIAPDFNLADCAWAALFSRLRELDLKLTGDFHHLIKYAERLFARPSVQRTLGG